MAVIGRTGVVVITNQSGVGRVTDLLAGRAAGKQGGTLVTLAPEAVEISTANNAACALLCAADLAEAPPTFPDHLAGPPC